MPGFGDLDALDDYLDGELSVAAGLLAEGKTARLFDTFRDKIAGIAGLKHEQTNGLLTPEALADQVRREAIGRQAAQHDAIARSQMPEMTINGIAPGPAAQPAGHSTAGCARGVHEFGQLRGVHGEAECRNCGVVFVAPP